MSIFFASLFFSATEVSDAVWLARKVTSDVARRPLHFQRWQNATWDYIQEPCGLDEIHSRARGPAIPLPGGAGSATAATAVVDVASLRVPRVDLERRIGLKSSPGLVRTIPAPAVLLIEDDLHTVRLVAQSLQAAGMLIVKAFTAEQQFDQNWVRLQIRSGISDGLGDLARRDN